MLGRAEPRCRDGPRQAESPGHRRSNLGAQRPIILSASAILAPQSRRPTGCRDAPSAQSYPAERRILPPARRSAHRPQAVEQSPAVAACVRSVRAAKVAACRLSPAATADAKPVTAKAPARCADEPMPTKSENELWKIASLLAQYGFLGRGQPYPGPAQPAVGAFT